MNDKLRTTLFSCMPWYNIFYLPSQVGYNHSSCQRCGSVSLCFMLETWVASWFVTCLSSLFAWLLSVWSWYYSYKTLALRLPFFFVFSSPVVGLMALLAVGTESWVTQLGRFHLLVHKQDAIKWTLRGRRLFWSRLPSHFPALPCHSPSDVLTCDSSSLSLVLIRQLTLYFLSHAPWFSNSLQSDVILSYGMDISNLFIDNYCRNFEVFAQTLSLTHSSYII